MFASHDGFSSIGSADYTVGSVGPDSDQQITVQALITVNAGVNPNLLKERAPLYRSDKAKVIGMGDVDAARLKVEPGELFFAEKDMQFMDSGKTAFRVSGFSSFNGIEIRERSQEAFERRFICLGFATSPFYAEVDPPSRSGVAVQKAGSGTTVNNSKITFCPGDVFGWETPSIDDKQRISQYSTVEYRRRGHFSMQKKYIGIVKRITYQDIIGSFDYIANLTVKRNALLNIPERRRKALIGRPSDLTDTQQMCSVLKEYNMMAAYSGVMAAIERGIVTPTCGSLAALTDPVVVEAWATARAPLNANPELIQTHVTGLDSLTDTNLDAVVAAVTGAVGPGPQRVALKTTLEPLLKRFVSVAPGSAADIARRKEAYRAFASHLSSFFGLTDHETISRPIVDGVRSGPEDFSLTEMTNTRILLSALTQNSDEDYQKYSKYVGNEFSGDADLNPTDIFGTPTSHAPGIGRQMRSIYESTGRNLPRLYGRMLDSVYSTALGTVSNYSRPNGPLHYALA